MYDQDDYGWEDWREVRGAEEDEFQFDPWDSTEDE